MLAGAVPYGAKLVGAQRPRCLLFRLFGDGTDEPSHGASCVVVLIDAVLEHSSQIRESLLGRLAWRPLTIAAARGMEPVTQSAEVRGKFGLGDFRDRPDAELGHHVGIENPAIQFHCSRPEGPGAGKGDPLVDDHCQRELCGTFGFGLSLRLSFKLGLRINIVVVDLSKPAVLGADNLVKVCVPGVVGDRVPSLLLRAGWAVLQAP